MDIKEEIKSRISIVELVSQYIDLKKAGRNYRGLSPFTSEKSPSFFVSPEKEIAYCFSTNQGGDIFAFYQLVESCSFLEALKALGEKVGIDVSSLNLSENKIKAELSDKLIDIHNIALRYYQVQLKKVENKKFVDYLSQRGFELSQALNLGFGSTGNSYDGLVKELVKAKFTQEEIIESGLGFLNKVNKLQDRFRDRLMFAIKNPQGKLVAFAGRVLEKDAKLAKYINSPETSIYKKNQVLYGFSAAKPEIRKRDFVILVEGYFDQIACFLNGYQNTVAVSGTALTDNQLALIKRFTKNLYFCLDMDDAGIRALNRGVSLAIPLGFNIKVITLDGVKDPDEAFQKDSNLFTNSIADASDYFDFLINHEFLAVDESFRRDSVFVKKFVTRYLETVRLLPEEFIKDFYLRRLSKVTGLSFLNLQKSLASFKEIKQVGLSNVKSKVSYKYTVEDLFWTYVFMSPDVIKNLDQYQKIMELCLTQNQLYKDIILNYNANDFDNYLVPEIYKVKALELESGGLDVDRFDFNSEVSKLLLRMKLNYRKSRLGEIKMKLNNCSAKEQLQLLSQYKNLMSL